MTVTLADGKETFEICGRRRSTSIVEYFGGCFIGLEAYVKEGKIN